MIFHQIHTIIKHDKYMGEFKYNHRNIARVDNSSIIFALLMYTKLVQNSIYIHLHPTLIIRQ